MQDETLNPKRAKRLSARKDQPYKVVEDKGGREWLVGAVLDNGRLMELIKPLTSGKVRKYIAAPEYPDYKVILGENDLG